MKEEREASRAERKQADAALRMERSKAVAAQGRLRAETENLRAIIEQLQRRVEGQSSKANVSLISGLLEDSRNHYQLGQLMEVVSYQRSLSLRDRS